MPAALSPDHSPAQPAGLFLVSQAQETQTSSSYIRPQGPGVSCT